MKDIPVDRAGREMFDADGRKLSIAERNYAYRINELEAENMDDCEHAYYQSAKCQGDWLCEHCGSVISTWQRLNLAFIERDKLRVENTELRELCDKADIIMERMAEEAQEDDRIRTLAQAAVDKGYSLSDRQCVVDKGIFDALAKALGD